MASDLRRNIHIEWRRYGIYPRDGLLNPHPCFPPPLLPTPASHPCFPLCDLSPALAALWPPQAVHDQRRAAVAGAAGPQQRHLARRACVGGGRNGGVQGCSALLLLPVRQAPSVGAPRRQGLPTEWPGGTGVGVLEEGQGRRQRKGRCRWALERGIEIARLSLGVLRRPRLGGRRAVGHSAAVGFRV